MADYTLSILQLSDILKDELVDSGNYQCNLLKILPIIPARNANAVNWAVDGYSGAPAETFSEGADVSTYTAATQFKPTLGYARYRDSKNISGSALRQASLSVAPTATRDLLAEKIREAVKYVTLELGVDSFTGTGGNGLVGIQTAIDVSSTYGGVDRSTNQGFRSTEVTGSGAALSLPMLRNLLLSTTKRARNAKPTHLVGSFDTMGKIMGLADSNFRVSFDGGAADRAASKGLSIGFDYIDILGVPFVADNNCPDGEIYAINDKVCHWEYVPCMNNDATGYAMGNAVDSLGDRLMLPFIMQPLSKLGDSCRFSVISELALVVRDPSKCGKLTNFI